VRGSCSLVGIPPGDFSTPIFDVVLKRITVRGSIVGTRKDLQKSLDFAGTGKVTPTVEGQPLEAINKVFDRMKKGGINGRGILDFEN